MLGRRNWAGEPKEAKQARWAFLSDTHIPADTENNYRGFYPYRNLQKVVAQIAADLPEGAIITGDLQQILEAYQRSRRLFIPDAPGYARLVDHLAPRAADNRSTGG